MSRSLLHLFGGAIETLRECVLPKLADPTARANAFSVLQVLELLALRVDWATGPLQSQLDARQAAIAAMPASARQLWQEEAAVTGPITATIDQVDSQVTGLVRALDELSCSGEVRTEIERWVLRYCLAATAEELKSIPRSQLGQLTSKRK